MKTRAELKESKLSGPFFLRAMEENENHKREWMRMRDIEALLFTGHARTMFWRCTSIPTHERLGRGVDRRQGDASLVVEAYSATVPTDDGRKGGHGRIFGRIHVGG